MSRHGVILDTATVCPEAMELVLSTWPDKFTGFPFPRSAWLRFAETVLAEYFPASSSADRNRTARSLAPFPLREAP